MTALRTEMESLYNCSQVLPRLFHYQDLQTQRLAVLIARVFQCTSGSK